MNIRPLESLTKEELIEIIRHERRGGLVERPDEYAYFSDWYAKDAPDEIGVSALCMARPAEPSRSDPDAEREKWLASLFPEDRMFEEIDQMARESYKRHMSLKRGQMVVRADSMDSHIVWATKRWIEKNEPVKVPSDDDSLTIAYMCGYHDGKRSTTPEGWQLVPVEPTPDMIDAARSQSSFPLGVYRAMLAAAPAVKKSLTAEPTDSEMLGILIEMRRELQACQAVINLAGFNTPSAASAALAAINKADIVIKAMRGEE